VDDTGAHPDAQEADATHPRGPPPAETAAGNQTDEITTSETAGAATETATTTEDRTNDTAETPEESTPRTQTIQAADKSKQTKSSKAGAEARQ
jgi:hypothetical protein